MRLIHFKTILGFDKITIMALGIAKQHHLKKHILKDNRYPASDALAANALLYIIVT